MEGFIFSQWKWKILKFAQLDYIDVPYNESIQGKNNVC